MCQHNLPRSIVLPTACFPEGPSPHFTLCSFWRRRPRLEAVHRLSSVLLILYKKDFVTSILFVILYWKSFNFTSFKAIITENDIFSKFVH